MLYKWVRERFLGVGGDGFGGMGWEAGDRPLAQSWIASIPLGKDLLLFFHHGHGHRRGLARDRDRLAPTTLHYLT